MKTNEAPVIVQQIFKSRPEKLWQAITRVDLMCQWFFENIPDFKAQPGFKTQFNVHSSGRNFIHKWQVIKVIPHKWISIKWHYANYPGDSVVSFELAEQENGTKLQLTHRILKDFPGDIIEFKRESCLSGWKYFINERLKNFLQQNSWH